MKRFGLIAMISSLVVFVGCGKKAGDEKADTSTAPPNVMEVKAVGLQFEAPKTVPGGWITFRLNNESEMTHFALVEQLPLGKGIKDQQTEVAPIFQAGMDLINEGKPHDAMNKFREIPEWFSETKYLGGTGLTGPGKTAETTVYLEPGTYLLECYVKTVGIFHSYNPDPDQYGMVHEFVVGEPSPAPEPEADVNLTISTEGGIEGAGDLAPGTHTVAVHYKDQKAYANFIGHDVHLARLTPDTDLEELGTWMNWSDPAGLEVPAPVEFLGGVDEMPAGKTGYMTVTLEPGEYAWISEVPQPAEKGMLRRFSVKAGP